MATIEKRKRKNGNTVFRAKVRLRGNKSESETFHRLTDAKKWIQATEAAIREGRYFKTSEARKRTMSEALDRYTESVLPQKKKSKHSHRFKADQTHQLLWWKKEIGHLFISDVTSSVVADKRDKLLSEKIAEDKTRSGSTVCRYLAVLSHVFTTAMKEWAWVDENPIAKIRKPKESNGRVRFLSDEERDRLLKACEESSNSYLLPAVVLALSTGMRKSELMNLRWRDVDLNRSRIVLHETKNGERRGIPLTGYAKNLLTELSKIRVLCSDLLFPSEKIKDSPIDLRKAWEAARKKAEISNFRFHDLRHCTASYLAMSGASAREIGEILGHKTLQMVKRYSHLSETHTSKVLKQMTEKMFNIQ